MSDIFTPPPCADDPFDLLKACHRKLESRLEALAVVAERLAAGTAGDKVVEALNAGIKQFDGPGRWHLQDEEESVLPRLLAKDPAVQELIDALAPDHEAIERGWADLRPVLVGLRDTGGADAALVARLQALLPEFSALHFEHHRFEESQVMPRARAVLGVDDVAAIAAEMRARRES
jgi:hypothetical protein